jgi:peptidoglycan-associated lipoprotein
MKHRSTVLLIAIATGFALGGCASNAPLQHAPVVSKTSGSGQAAASGASQVAPVQAATPVQSSLGPGSSVGRSVYFAFDRYNVSSKYQSVLEGNAAYLSSHPAAHVQVQGNTDARGSREYNLALGQRRAGAVVKGMELLGANASQMEAVSFGKEKPKALGTTAADYAENRRADIVYNK